MAEVIRSGPLRIKASSLIEVTVALVIISMIFTIATTIYLNVQRSGFSSGKLLHNMMLDDAYNQAMKSKDFKTKEIPYDDVTVYQDVQPASENKDLMILKFELRNMDGSLLAERKYLLYVPV